MYCWRKLTHIFKDCNINENIHIHTVFDIKNDIYVITTIQYYDPSYKKEECGITIYIVYLLTQTIIQTINKDHPETIRRICDYKNGFIVLTSKFELNTYDCV